MKKLSDIGRASFGFKATRTEDGRDVSWGSCKQFFYTEEERLEMLDLVWNAAREKYTARVWQYIQGHGNTLLESYEQPLWESLEEFLEEQGL